MPEQFPHKMIPDIQKVLDSNKVVSKLWNTLTPLAQNEWICWVTFVKLDATYQQHLVRIKEDILKGKRRPCCWSGCPHRPGHLKKVYTAKSKVK